MYTTEWNPGPGGQAADSATAAPVIGLGGSGHEWASCVADQGAVTAVAEERVTRLKYGLGADLLRAESRRACLAGLDDARRQAAHTVVCDLVPKTFYFPVRGKAEVINHHLAHAHCAFATSGLQEAAILVVDNSGSILSGSKTGTEREVETISMFDADSSGIRLVHKITGIHALDARTEDEFYQAGETSNSLGHLYRAASIALGFAFTNPKGGGVFSEDGKTMGLSPYGDDRFISELGSLIELTREGGVQCDAGRINRFMARHSRARRFEDRAGLAAATQFHLERAMMHLADHLHGLTGRKALCIAGGVGLNSVANGLLARQSKFDHVYVPPAPSDDGIAIGCAAYGVWTQSGQRPVFPRSAYFGPRPSDKDIERVVAQSGLPASRPDGLVSAAAALLARGKVLGWYQGRSEFGPRALGHRSILALPSPGHVRDVLNHEMKRREWFRPYAPMVPAELTSHYFDFPQDSPHMSFVAPVLKPDQLPAATHVDGTARLQTISKEDNPLMHALLHEMGASVGTPILLNTSFNKAGEPIVETPQEALQSAMDMSLDVLVLGDWIVQLATERL